ncbi:MAG: hypothetical protein QOG64_1352 [Acidimicrobiaceae bacterium]|nr:hypothetical protein [Acidimicrobiaceae bacterium]
MLPEEIGLLVDVGDPRVSPDGRFVAVVVTTMDMAANEYRNRIWVVASDGSSPPWPLTVEDGRCSHPRWSPDGASIAFVAVEEAKDDRPLVLLRTVPVTTAGGARTEPTQLAEWRDDVDDLAWSPDGRHIAFLARQPEEERYSKTKAKDQPPRRITTLFYKLDNVGWTVDRHRHLFIVPSDGSEAAKAITGGPFEDAGLAWSPDGSRLAFASARQPDWDLSFAVDLFIVGADGGSCVQVTDTELAWARPSWSPDGQRLGATVYDARTAARHSQIGIIDLDRSASTVLTAELDRHCAPSSGAREPVWQGDAIWFLLEDAGNAHLYRVDGADGRPELVLGGERVITSFDVAGGTVAFCATTPTTLTELSILDADGSERRLTDFGSAFTGGRALSSPQRFVATSVDGTPVEAWVMPPIDPEPGRRYPTLLNIHGGPFTQYGNRFFDEFQVQAGAGFAVVYANPRGSSGYSEASARAIRWPECKEDPGSGWGGVDYEDLMAVVDVACSQFDFVDPDRLGVIGGSYGGYMTSWIIAHSDRFQAALSERSVNDLLAEEADSDIASWFVDYVGVSHVDDPEPYIRQSPLTYVKNMTTPLLIMHSENDLRCPVSQAESLFVALRLLGREVEMVRFPGEGHELSRSGAPVHRVQRAEIIVEFFARHLLG